MTADFERTPRADAFRDLDAEVVRQVLDRKGWRGLVVENNNLSLTLGQGFCVVVIAGKEGERNLAKLSGAHGDLPSTPTFNDASGNGEPRVVRVYALPQGASIPNAPNLHGAVAGVSVITIGAELLPPSVKASTLLRWRPAGHPSTRAPAELPSWLVDLARDPAAAHRAWGVARPSKTALRALAEWESGLVRARGRTVSTFGNLCKIFRNCPEFSGRFALNEMTQAVEFEGKPLPEGRIGAFRERIEDAPWGGFSPSETQVMQAVRTVAEERRYNPVREYLRGLTWDNVKRLDAVPGSVLHAQEAPLLVETVRRWFISAVARAMRPGEKVDTALVLVGPQGMKKSTFFYELAPRWFGDTEIRIGDKDAYGQIHANWITEWGELDRITDQRHAADVKAFVARRTDHFRPPYGRTTDAFPRSCVIVGSVNPTQFLNDPTGARRFWCVTVTREVDIELLRSWRDQLWAEARAALDAGEQWWFDGEQEAIRSEHVERHRRRDPWEELIARWLDEGWPMVREKKNLSFLTTGIVLECALQLQPRDMTNATQDRVGKALAALKYESDQVRVPRRELGLYKKPGTGQELTRINAWFAPGEPHTAPAPQIVSDPPGFPP